MDLTYYFIALTKRLVLVSHEVKSRKALGADCLSSHLCARDLPVRRVLRKKFFEQFQLLAVNFCWPRQCSIEFSHHAITTANLVHVFIGIVLLHNLNCFMHHEDFLHMLKNDRLTTLQCATHPSMYLSFIFLYSRHSSCYHSFGRISNLGWRIQYLRLRWTFTEYVFCSVLLSY